MDQQDIFAEDQRKLKYLLRFSPVGEENHHKSQQGCLTINFLL